MAESVAGELDTGVLLGNVDIELRLYMSSI